ncbi:MAG: hypothetical protein ACTXOO_02660 [Sodalis sp. (in: enterobacteria)]
MPGLRQQVSMLGLNAGLFAQFAIHRPLGAALPMRPCRRAISKIPNADLLRMARDKYFLSGVTDDTNCNG